MHVGMDTMIPPAATCRIGPADKAWLRSSSAGPRPHRATVFCSGSTAKAVVLRYVYARGAGAGRSGSAASGTVPGVRAARARIGTGARWARG